MGFVRSAVDHVGASADWADIEQSNAVLDRLQARRVPEVRLGASKREWRIAVLQQAFLYRTIALAKGCADAWNAGNVLCSVLAARALLETIAVVEDFERQLSKLVEASNL